jgi:argininosuccinate synthase
MAKEKIVLAYSGGLDTSVAISWLKEMYGYDVVALCMDVGDEGLDLNFIKEKALKIGAVHSEVLDVKAQFAQEYILPALQSNALYEGIYPLVSALSRPIIAKALVDLAHKMGATAVAHGCTGKGNDQVRFDISIRALDPNLKIVAPAREAPMPREDAISYAKERGIPLPIQLDNPFSIDQNLWGRSCECGVLEDPWATPPEAAYAWTKSLENTPNQPDELIIHFVEGVPVGINGENCALHELIADLNRIAGLHGIGRIDHVENRLVGIKSREIYEAPAAMTLITAHKALETLTLPRESMHFKPLIEQKMANVIYEGLWYSPLRKALMAFIQETQVSVTGEVRLQLFKGHATVVGRRSPRSLYRHDLATYNVSDQFDHQAAEGFIKLWGLPTEVYAQINSKE